MKLRKFSKSTYIIFFAIITVFILSFIIFLSDFSGTRKTFIFSSISSEEEFVESRYLTGYKKENLINAYIEELLLGPINELSKPLFPKGTRLDSCFLRNSVLYVELSSDILNYSNFSVDYKKSFQLLEKNIKNNFYSVKSCEFYINGSEGSFKIFENQ